MSHKKYRKETNCLNCGSEVTGKFCSDCGQENIETRENFFHLAFHTIGDFFHFDSKFFRSMIPLFVKPGFLTQEYWAGRRTNYIHPLRLFFFATIVMVIIANAYYHKYEKQIKAERITRSSTSVNDSLEPKTEQERLQRERMGRKIVSGTEKVFDYAAAYLKYISFLLLPIYAFGFKLLYIRSKKLYVDHLVYTLHFQSFVNIVVSLLLLIPLFFLPSAREWFLKVTLILSILYIIISLRFLYQQSWLKTILKSFLALGYIAFITLTCITAAILISVV
jgi:hypothetical protein